MARTRPLHRRRFRQSVALGAVLLAALGGFALEHTATGATPGRPAHPNNKHETTTASPSDNHGGNPDKHCNNGHGRDKEKNKHCRPPSGE